MSSGFTDGTAIEGTKRRVAVVSCRRCGAALAVDPADDIDVLALHQAWHADEDAT